MRWLQCLRVAAGCPTLAMPVLRRCGPRQNFPSLRFSEVPSGTRAVGLAGPGCDVPGQGQTVVFGGIDSSSRAFPKGALRERICARGRLGAIGGSHVRVRALSEGDSFCEAPGLRRRSQGGSNDGPSKRTCRTVPFLERDVCAGGPQRRSVRLIVSNLRLDWSVGVLTWLYRGLLARPLACFHRSI